MPHPDQPVWLVLGINKQAAAFYVLNICLAATREEALLATADAAARAHVPLAVEAFNLLQPPARVRYFAELWLTGEGLSPEETAANLHQLWQSLDERFSGNPQQPPRPA